MFKISNISGTAPLQSSSGVLGKDRIQLHRTNGGRLDHVLLFKYIYEVDNIELMMFL
jgi:hypothetical protein